MSELYPVLVLKGLGWLLMAHFTPHSRADVAHNFVAAASQSHTVLDAYSPVPKFAKRSGMRLSGKMFFTTGPVLA